jgi:hypothetical protein
MTQISNPSGCPCQRDNGQPNRFHRKAYVNLGDYKTSLDLRTIRNIVVKQTRPEGDNAIFEVFNRLNTGGVNLSPQEIRVSLYHSKFMEQVLAMNLGEEWRRLLGVAAPDTRSRDVESILRAFALARNIEAYGGSMTAFINNFCRQAKNFDESQVKSARESWDEFMSACSELDETAFHTRPGKFSGLLFEAIFATWIQLPPEERPRLLDSRWVGAVKDDPDWAKSLQEGSTKTANVKARLAVVADHVRVGGQ